MALFDHVMVPRNGSMTIEDNTGGTPISISLMYDKGDFQVSAGEAGWMKTQVFRSRGVEFTIVEVEEEEVEVTFTAHATDFSDNTEKTLWDMAHKTGAFAAGVSVFGANRPWGVKLTYKQEQTNYGGGADSTLVFAKCRPSIGFVEAESGTFQLRFRIFNPSSTITRS